LTQPLQASGSPLELAACTALDIVGLPIIVVDTGGRVQQFNSAAKSRLRSGPLKLTAGRLAGANELDTRRLREAIRWAEDAQPAETRNVPLSAPHHGVIQQVVVAPLPTLAEGGNGPPLALVILTNDALAPPLTVPPAHLTEAELRLLKGLIAGERLGTYAARSGVKLSTVKTHLQSLFDKFGERRQTDLVRRAMSDPALRQRLAPSQEPD
jgi:DNA-binding CsgD family transcriptional regulator